MHFYQMCKRFIKINILKRLMRLANKYHIDFVDLYKKN